MSKDDLTVIEGGKGDPIKEDGRRRKVMTAKQKAFVRGMISDNLSASDSYRAAYNTANMKAATVNSEAYKLMQNPLIAASLSASYKALEDTATHTGASLRLHLEKTLFKLSQKKGDDSTVLKACHQLAQSEKVGFYLQRTETKDVTSMNEAELIEELQAQLKAAFAS